MEELAKVIESMDERSKKDDTLTSIYELFDKNGAGNVNHPIAFPDFLNIMIKKTKVILLIIIIITSTISEYLHLINPRMVHRKM